ncbi:MAG TPA: GDP-mannose 4,6-dehydratase [archaeon]|nr:GDP-mannose 4,6-dehydratase [archaeon]
MKVLVTGACGFIGTNLCESLLNDGHEVIGLDDFSGKYPLRAFKKNSLVLKHKKGKFIKASVLDREKILSLSKKSITHIVHLAAKAGVRDSVLFPKKYLETNIVGTQNILDLALAAKIKHVVLASTSSVYGTNKPPFRETMHIDTPLSVYAASKVGMEALAYSYYNIHSLPITVLRFFTVYGSRGRRDMSVYKFAKLISEAKKIHVYGNGNQKRDFTYVADIVQGIRSAMKLGKGYNTFNLGCSTTVKLNYMIGLLEKNIGKKAVKKHEKARPEDPIETHADISKARRELGFEPKTKIEKGIALFCKWFRENPD